MFTSLSIINYQYNFTDLLNMCKDDSVESNKTDLDIVNSMIIPVAQKHIENIISYNVKSLSKYGINVKVNIYENE